ncbi:MAG: hypothetical protein ACR2LQ_06445 [Acidimicrobiales bacterium]
MFRRTIREDVSTGDGERVAADRYDRVDERSRVVDPNRVIALLAGLGFLLLGALVLVDTGFGDFPSNPIASVAGFTQTPLLGVIDVALGLLLLAGAADRDRSMSVFAGGLMLVAGIVAAVEAEKLPAAVRTNSGFGWTVALVGAIVLIAALVIPTAYSRSRVVRSDQTDTGR